MLKHHPAKNRFFQTGQKPGHKGSPFKDPDFNLTQLQIEFSTLYQLLDSNPQDLDRAAKWTIHLRKLCHTLIRYYQHDYVKLELADLVRKQKRLKSSSQTASASSVDFPSFIWEEIQAKALDYTSSLTSSASLRKQISRLNANRTWWNCSRRLSGFAVKYLEDAGLPDTLKPINRRFGHHYHPDDLNTLLDRPREGLHALSVGLYGARLMINVATMFKHIINAQGDPLLSVHKVAAHELEKRGFSMLNDLVWGTVNLLTNYSEYCGLPSQHVAPIIMSAYLFDFALFVARWMTDSHQVQVWTERKNHMTQLVSRQCDVLHDEWQAKCAYYQINLLAASVLIISYGSTFLIQAPLACASLNMLANGLYNSAGDYQSAQQSTLALQREQENGIVEDSPHHRASLLELQKARREGNTRFWMSLMFNACSAVLIITTASLSWPVALGLTLSLFTWRSHEAHARYGQGKTRHDIYRLFPANNELRSSGEQKSLPPRITLKPGFAPY